MANTVTPYRAALDLLRQAATNTGIFASIVHVPAFFDPNGQSEGLRYPAFVIELEAAARVSGHRRTFAIALGSYDLIPAPQPDTDATDTGGLPARLSDSLERLGAVMSELYRLIQAADLGKMPEAWTALPRIAEGGDLAVGYRAEIDLELRWELWCPATPGSYYGYTPDPPIITPPHSTVYVGDGGNAQSVLNRE